MSAQNKKPLFSFRDIMEAGRLLALLPVALLVPVARWSALSRGIARIGASLFPSTIRFSRRHIAKVLKSHTGTPPDQLAITWVAGAYLLRLHLLRMNVFRRWQPAVRLTGETILTDALQQGRGAVLWVSTTSCASVAAKLALSGAGYPVYHLSRPTHGFSTTLFGIRFLNRIRSGVEERFVAERVLIREKNPTSAMRKLRKLLTKNAIVSITVGRSGARTHSAPFFNGRLTLATGAPQLAYAAGAPLLPVFCHLQNNGCHTVEIGAPLAAEARTSATVFTEMAIEEYVCRLQKDIQHRPEEWTGWKRVALNSEPPSNAPADHPTVNVLQPQK